MAASLFAWLERVVKETRWWRAGIGKEEGRRGKVMAMMKLKDDEDLASKFFSLWLQEVLARDEGEKEKEKKEEEERRKGREK